MRNFLVTKLICSDCGKVLTLSDKQGCFSSYADGEPTGALKVDQTISVVPCECKNNQIEAMRNAAKILFSAIETKEVNK